jgi:hypothetical protein
LLFAFELYIKDEIEKLVEKTSETQEGPGMFDVAVITFATANQTLIKLLKERGSYITEGKLKKIKNIDAKINSYRERNSNKLKTPVKAYVTFEKQVGYEVASRITGGYNLFG